MRLGVLAACSIGAVLVGCAAAPPLPPAAPEPEVEEADPAAPDEPAPPPSAIMATSVDAPERSRPPSAASYEEGLATPEAVNVHDDRLHLTDLQLTNPMRSVISGCRVPWKAKVTIKTAVQNGRAIGVTVDVHVDKPKSTRRPSKAAARAEAKAIAKVAACIDHNVRAVVWPPSQRRDSFTMEF